MKFSNIKISAAWKIKFSIKDYFSKYDQITVWSHLQKKSLMENFNFCIVCLVSEQKGAGLMHILSGKK